MFKAEEIVVGLKEAVQKNLTARSNYDERTVLETGSRVRFLLGEVEALASSRRTIATTSEFNAVADILDSQGGVALHINTNVAVEKLAVAFNIKQPSMAPQSRLMEHAPYLVG